MHTEPSNPELFTFDLEHMQALAQRHHAAYQANRPFPHIVIDNFFPAPVAERLLECFPSVHSPVFVNRSFPNQPGKFGTVNGENIAKAPAFIQHIMAMLNSYAMIHFLGQLTGIGKLLADPHFSGGGLHQIVNGGKLDVHADFNFEEKLNLYRRINVLIYLNKNWQESYGGYLELWDKQLTTCHHKIAPLFNRCVIFNTSRYSYHGHPSPLRVPEGVTRKSLALYYYSKEPFPGEEKVHFTTWQKTATP